MNESPSAFSDPWANLQGTPTPVRVAFWWFKRSSSEPPRFVYSFVVPARSIRREQWGRYNLDDGPLRLIRRTLDISGSEAFQLLEKLRASERLAEACVQMGLPDPYVKEDSFVVDPSWTRLPPIFLSAIPSKSLLTVGARGRASPVNGAGAVCARLSPADRLKFLDGDEKPDESLQWVARKLEGETGLAFDSVDADAFGSIEVFEFPGLDAQERLRLSILFEGKGSDSQRTVRLELDQTGLTGRFMVQVRAEQLNDVCFDELIELDSERRGSVVVPTQFDGALVRLWRELDGRWVLWDEYETHFLREIHSRMHVQGLTGTVDSPWLPKASKRAQSKVEAFMQIRQVSADIPMQISYRPEWEKSIIAAREAVNRINPPASKGKFFPAGWGGSMEGRLDFGLWLKEVLSGHEGKIVLTDPYFDLLGLDLISRASGAASEFVVLTSTVLKSYDDDGHPGMPRNERLKKASESYLTILRGLSLRILDLKSLGKSTKQVFHDRYLMLFDSDWRIQEGFQLSTSLQSAATRSPLLVSPIPSDVLDEVADYVTSLFNGARPEVGSEMLFPPAETRATRRHQGLSERKARTVLSLMALTQGRDDLLSEDPAAKLRELGVYDGEKVVLELSSRQLEIVREYLRSSSIAHSAHIWDGLVKVATHRWMRGIPDLLADLFAKQEPDLAQFLRTYLIEHGKGVLRAEDASEHTRTLSHVLGLPFTKAIGDAANFYDYHHRLPLGTSWPIHLAAICLVQFYPVEFDTVIAELKALGESAARLLDEGQIDKSDPRAVELSATQAQVPAVLSALVAVLATYAQRRDGLVFPAEVGSSRVPFIRALFAISAWREARSGEPGSEEAWAKFVELLEQYSVEERQEILGQAIYEVRIRANQNQPPWPVRDQVFEEFRKQLEPKVSADRLVALMPFLSGPVLCNHSTSIHNEILHPLTERGVATGEEVFEVWDRILQERMKDEYLGHADAELVQVWGYSFWDATSAQRAVCLGGMRESTERARWTLLEPFLCSRNSKRWADAQGVVLWALFQAWSIRTQASSSPAAERASPEERDEVESLFRSLRTFVEEERLVKRAIGLAKDFGEHILGLKSAR